jgi:superfamily II DNA or RNA helicase
MGKTTCKVRTHLELEIAGLPRSVIERLCQHLTVANPEREQAARSGRDPSSIPALVKLYEVRSGTLFLPRGAVQVLRGVASSEGIEIEWDSQVVSVSQRRVPFRDLGVVLRDYQRDGVEALVRGVQGYIKAPCGSGKTIMGTSAMVVTGETGLVLVHTHDLLHQWVDLFRSWDLRVRSISSGSKNLEPLALRYGEPEYVVATIQTAHRLGKQIQPLLDSVGAVLLDEAHHAPATTFRSVLERCASRYRWGLTATPSREDGWGMLLPLVLGPERWGISMGQLVDSGHLLRPVVLSLSSGVDLDLRSCSVSGRLNMSRAVNKLCADEGRHTLLLDVAEVLANQGRSTLLLVPRVAQAHTLANHLQERGIVAMSVAGDTPGGLRKQRIRNLREGRIQVLVATQLADEGLDVPNLEAVVVASTGRAAGRAVQRIGRVMRTAPGKRTPVVVDVADPPPFSGQWRARARAYYEELGVAVPRPTSWQEVREIIVKA